MSDADRPERDSGPFRAVEGFVIQPRERERFRFVDPEELTNVASQQFGLVRERLENHEGRLMGLQSSMSVLQSALQSGFAVWLSVIGIVAAAILALGGWNMVQMRADTDNVRSDVRQVQTDVRTLSEKMDNLPAKIEAERQRSRRR